MKKKIGFIFTFIMTAFLLSGCQSDAERAETEALKQQINDLQNQLSELQQGTAANENASTESPAPQTQDVQNSEQQQAPLPQETPDTQTESTESLSAGISDTIGELTSLVDDFVQKGEQASLSSTGDAFDQFLSLKKESNQIETQIDAFEDELERQYRDGTLSWDEYRDAERELESLEDSLDHAEDNLERIFGVDD